MKKASISRCVSRSLFAMTALAAMGPALGAAWEPTKPVEFVVPAGTGGGADQMARLLQGVISKNNLMKQPLIVVNKSGGAGAEGFLAVKEAKGDPNKIIITLSNLFTTPLATGVPFNWKDLTPVAMLALDQFVLWVNAETPYKTAKEYLDAVKAGGPNKFKMGGTGSKQEDQIITVAIEKATGVKFTYMPFKGGGDVAVQLVGKHIDSSVNNPIEAVAQWRAGKLRPLCVFDDTRMPYKTKVTDTMSWNDIPTCKEAGVPTDYVMLRGIFMPAGVDQGTGRLLRRSVQEGARNAGVEKVHGRRRVQHDVHERARIREMGRESRKHPPRTDERSGVSGQADNSGSAATVARGAVWLAARSHCAALTSQRLMDHDETPPAAGGFRCAPTRIGSRGRCCSCSAPIVVYDSYRLGSKWGSDGPQSGYFPFYIGLLICIASAINLAKAVTASRRTRSRSSPGGSSSGC